MKRQSIILFVLFTFAFSICDLHSQGLRSRLINKVLDDNLEAQAKRDSAKAVEAGEKPDKHPNTSMDHVYMDALGLSGNVDYNQTYQFSSYIRMEVSEYNKKGDLDEKTLYDSYTDKESLNYAMVFTEKGNTSTVIFDSENSSMLVLSNSDGEKTGMAMAFDEETMAEAEEAEEAYDETASYTYAQYKTGKTKNILGYTCDEYRVTDEQNEARMWVAEKLRGELRKEMLNNQQTFGAIFYHAYYMNGMVLEYDFLDKDDGDRVVMQVTDIDLNRKHTISTREYAVMSFTQPPSEESEE